MGRRETRDGADARRLIDSAFLVAGVTGMLYMAGRSYHAAYLRNHGFPAAFLQHEPPFLMMEGFLRILPLAAIVFGAALLYRFLVGGGNWRSGRYGRFAGPATLVVVIWFLYAFMAVIAAPRPQAGQVMRWMGAGLGAVGAIVMVVWFARIRAEATGRPKVVDGSTLALAATMVVVDGLILGAALARGVWTFNTIESIFLAGVTLGAATSLYLDLGRGPRRIRFVEPDAAIVLMFIALALFLALASLELHGMADATEERHGCARVKSIWFDPMPEGLPENSTFWLVWQQDDTYYVKTLPTDSTSEVFAVEKTPGMVAGIAYAPKNPDC